MRAPGGRQPVWREYAVESRSAPVLAVQNRTGQTCPVTEETQVTGHVPAGERVLDLGCPRQDSNLRPRLRRAVLYPLSYGGPVTSERVAGAGCGRRGGFGATIRSG